MEEDYAKLVPSAAVVSLQDMAILCVVGNMLTPDSSLDEVLAEIEKKLPFIARSYRARLGDGWFWGCRIAATWGRKWLMVSHKWYEHVSREIEIARHEKDARQEKDLERQQAAFMCGMAQITYGRVDEFLDANKSIFSYHREMSGYWLATSGRLRMAWEITKGPPDSRRGFGLAIEKHRDVTAKKVCY
jgi:hypothetical protein